MNKNFDSNIPALFLNKRRSGTYNQGIDYEIKIFALIALKAVTFLKNQSNFLITQNVDHELVGIFDDIVFISENKIYCLQLKHFGHSTRNIIAYETLQKKIEKRGKRKVDNKLYLSNYLDSLKKVSKPDAPVEVIYILFTNREVDKTETKFLEKNFDASFLNVNGFAFTLDKFKCEGGKFYSKESFENFLVLSGQPNEEILENVIRDEIFRIFNCSSKIAEENSQKYIHFIANWFKDDSNEKRFLSKDDIVFEICKIFTEKFVVSDTNVKYKMDSAVLDEWKNIIDRYDLVLIDGFNNKETEDNELIFSYCISSFSSDLFSLWMQNKMHLLLEIYEERDYDLLAKLNKWCNKKFLILCKKQLSNIPIEKNSSMLNAFIDLDSNVKNRILNRKVMLQGRRASLSDVLKNAKLESQFSIINIVKVLMDKFSIGIKNYELPPHYIERTLKNVLVNPEIFKKSRLFILLSTTELFQDYIRMCKMKINFKDQVKDLTSLNLNNEVFDFFIVARSGSRNKDEIKNFCIRKNLNCNIVELKRRNNKDVDDFIISYKHFVNVFVASADELLRFLMDNKIQVSFEEIYLFKELEILVPFTCKYIVANKEDAAKLGKKFKHINFHFYIINEGIIAEFVGAYGECSEINLFKQENVTVDRSFDQNYCFDLNRINIITGSPGVGKTSLLNNFMKNCPQHYWSVYVNCNEDIEDIFKENLNDFDKTFYDYCVSEENVAVFIDGYDELSTDSENNSSDFIKDLSAKNYTIFIATRNVKAKELKQEFKSVCRELVPFSEADRNKYFVEFYKFHLPEAGSDKIESFVCALLKQSSNSFKSNFWDSEFSGIALQTVMIAEIYLDKCEAFCASEEPQNVIAEDILNIYQQFIEKKISFLSVKENITKKTAKYFKIAMNQSLKNHRLCALKEIFHKIPEADSLTGIVEEIKNCEDKIGLIDKFLNDDTPIFIHRTFAEYLSAVYMSENVGTSFVTELFEILHGNSTYDVVRQILDRILAKNCPIHMTVLNRDLANFEKFLEQEQEQSPTVDDGGRNVLHLVMSLGVRHTYSELMDEEDKIKGLKNLYSVCRPAAVNLEFLQKILSKDVFREMLTKDKIFKVTPLMYGLETSCFENVDLYLKYCDTDCQFDYLERTLCICSLYDYKHLVKCLVEKVSDIKLEALTYGTKQISLLHLAAWSGSDDVIRLLLDKGFDVDAMDKELQSALFYATLSGKASTVKLLLDKNANPDVFDVWDYSPQFLASISDHEEIATVLNTAVFKCRGFLYEFE